MLAPYTKYQKKPLNIEDVYDVEYAVDSLIIVFKCKIREAPITLAISIYYILLSCLEHHYQEPELLFKAVSLRYQVQYDHRGNADHASKHLQSYSITITVQYRKQMKKDHIQVFVCKLNEVGWNRINIYLSDPTGI